MRRRPGETPQNAGRRFERFWASIFGKAPTLGSGNQWWLKLDVGDGSITWSCKFTTHRSASISKEMIMEAREGVHKNGDNSIPGIAIALDDGATTVVVLEAADFVRLLSLENARYITPSKAAQKRSISRIPALLRDNLESP